MYDVRLRISFAHFSDVRNRRFFVCIEHNGRMITEFAIATQSSTFGWGSMLWSAEKAIDDCYDTTCSARTQREHHNWIRLDLRNVYKINSVVIYADTEESCKLYICS